MSPKYTLNYFNMMGVAEPIRFLLAYGGADYTDNRVPKDEWPKMKESTPLGQLPTLEFDGKVAYQSIAICRYLAKQFDLAGGSDEWESLLIDVAVDTITDFKNELVKPVRASDAETKKKLKEQMMNETFPFYLNKFDNQIKENKGYLVNGKLSWADLYFATLIDLVQELIPQDIAKKVIHVQALKDKIMALPAIKAWVAKRPFDERSAQVVRSILEA